MRVSVKNDPFILRFSVIPAYRNTTRIDRDLCAPLLYILIELDQHWEYESCGSGWHFFWGFPIHSAESTGGCIGSTELLADFHWIPSHGQMAQAGIEPGTLWIRYPNHNNGPSTQKPGSSRIRNFIIFSGPPFFLCQALQPSPRSTIHTQCGVQQNYSTCKCNSDIRTILPFSVS